MPGSLSWLASLVIALLTGLLGLFVTGLVASACVSWYQISSFEGGAGYFIVFTALAGGAAGAILGLVTARLVAAGAAPGFLKALGLSWGIAVGIAGVAALIAWGLADIPPTLGGQELDLEVEIRLPAGEPQPAPDSSGARFQLESIVNHRQRKARVGELKVDKARQENGRWIVPASAFLFTTRGERGISAELGGRSLAAFIVPLPGRPGTKFEQWSDWGPRPPSGEPPWPDSKSSFRFRVTRRH